MAIFHVTDSLRFTLALSTCSCTDGSTSTRPSRAAGGSRSHATKPPKSSSRTARQSSPWPAR
jgi:hypothetical protein